MEIFFRGAGGGSDSSSSSSDNFIQTPDNLRSNDTFEGLLGLCVGPIKGPVDGMKNIRVNDTPIEDTSGNLNFQDFIAVFADGDPLKFPQICTLRLGAAGEPMAINVQLRNTAGTGSGTWVTRTINNTGAEAIDLRFIVQALYSQDADGIYDTTADIEVQMKPVGTTNWINPFQANGNTMPPYDSGGYPTDTGSYTDPDTGETYVGGQARAYYTEENYRNQEMVMDGGNLSAATVTTSNPYLSITGKTTSPYVKELRVRVPNTGAYANKGWDIRCRLVEVESVDADPNFEKRTIVWESAAAVYNPKLGTDEQWRGFAWLQLYGKASDQFNGVPEVSGIYETKIVQVPPSSVFDPANRTYTNNIWDGSWAKAYTNDPAWVINDAISDSLSGIARLVPGAHLNKWDALELSKYASEKVSDGSGGQHPRFSMNLAVTEAQRSDDFIRYLAGACGATAWDNGEGEWRLAIDKPQTAVDVFTDEAIEGEFVYSHTDIDTRFNDVTVVFLNEEFDYREDRVRLTDEAHIAKYGRKPTKIVGIGCTHRQQAVRWAILKMRSNTQEFRAVTFTTNRRGKLIERFDWILIADGSLATQVDDTKRSTGRIVQNKGTSIVLRDTVRLETGVAYQIYFTVPNPNYNPDKATSPTDDTYSQPTITMTRNVTNTAAQRGDVRELFLDSAMPAGVAENANIALSAPGLPSLPVAYRVLDVVYADDGERITINAIEIDTGKYTASDTANYNYKMPGYGGGSHSGGGGVVPPPIEPTGGMWTMNSYNNTYTGVTRVLAANWDRPADFADFKCFQVDVKHNTQGLIMRQQLDDFLEIPDPAPGRYKITVKTVANSGKMSRAITSNINVPSITRSVYVSYGPTSLQGLFDSTGSQPQDLPKDALFKLSSNGVELDDATWQYRVVEGGVNGFNTKSGWKNMTTTGGIGTFTLSSIEVDNSRVEVKGTSQRRSASITTVIAKVLSDASYSGGTGSGGDTGTGSVAQTSGFGALAAPGTSFVAITGNLVLTMPTGKTTAQAVVNLSVTPQKSNAQTNDGPWDIEYKLQILNGSTWTDVGAIQHSSPDPYIDETTTGTQ